MPTKDIKSRGNILANFITNNKIEDLGFQIEFNIQPCGERITDRSGHCSKNTVYRVSVFGFQKIVVYGRRIWICIRIR
mgnify:CR=1 FL=1